MIRFDSIIHSSSYLRGILLSALLALLLPVGSAQARGMVPIRHGTGTGYITVDTMGGIPWDRVVWLVQIADRSSCTDNPSANDCDGFMSPGDRVVVGDNYMAFLDLTRQAGSAGNGGGGLLRGFWLLVNDSTGSRNFKYVDNGYNHAPNNLYPFQYLRHQGDAHQILAGRPGGQDADSFRATQSGSVAIWNDGEYDGNTHSLYYHFQGTMTQSNGNTNIGSSSSPATMYYHASYRFYNDYHPVGNDGNAFKVDVNLSVDICGSSGCNDPQISGVVFTLGISNQFADSRVRTNYFQPVSHDMGWLNYQGNPSSCVMDSSRLFSRGSVHPLSYNSPYGWYGNTQHWFATRRTYPWEPFAVKYKSDPSTQLSNFRVHVNNSTVSSYGVDVSNKVAHQVIHDASQYSSGGPVYHLYDIQIGGGMCGITMGTMPRNSWVAAKYTLSFEYQ